MEITDQLDRTLKLTATPCRIVSLVPSQTELLIDLGLKEELLGITKFCVHPTGLRKSKKVVGGTKQVHFDRIKALDPDIILCNKEENTKEMVLELEKIAPVHVSDIFDLDNAFELMYQYGEVFDRKTSAEKLVENIQNELKQLQKELQDKPWIKVAYFIWQKPFMVAGSQSFIDKLLQLNKLENVYKTPRYPETDLEELKDKNPELILLSSEPFPFKNKHKKTFPEKEKVVLVDGEYFSWYGSRLLKAMSYFRSLRNQWSICS